MSFTTTDMKVRTRSLELAIQMIELFRSPVTPDTDSVIHTASLIEQYIKTGFTPKNAKDEKTKRVFETLVNAQVEETE